MSYEKHGAIFRESYARWDLSFPSESMTPDTYEEYLASIQHHIPKLSTRIFPTSFNPYISGPVFARTPSWRWQTLADHLRTCKTSGVVVRLPLFWQVEPLVFYACQDAETFLFMNDAINMPVGRIALQHNGMNTVLTTREDAPIFVQHLQEHGAPLPRNWIIIHPLSAHTQSLPNILQTHDGYVAQEVHLFPGIPLFVQCVHAAQQRTALFHLAEGYTIEGKENGAALVTGTPDDLLPLIKYELPVTVKEQENMCECGAPLFSM